MVLGLSPRQVPEIIPHQILALPNGDHPDALFQHGDDGQARRSDGMIRQAISSAEITEGRCSPLPSGNIRLG